jgi:hypothetical protein
MPRVHTLGQIPQVNDFEKGRILEIARRIGRSVGTILRCCQGWTPEGRQHRARGTGRRRMTTRESRSIKGSRSIFCLKTLNNAIINFVPYFITTLYYY